MSNDHNINSVNDWLISRINSRALNYSLEGGINSDPLALLTVVVPSINRQAFLLRQIAYWQHTLVKVILVDGSPVPLNSLVLQSLQSLSRITYLHIPENVLERLTLASRRIDTPYTVMMGDDELHLFGGLRKAINELQKNSTLAGCMGQSIKFYVSKSNNQIVYGTGYHHFKYFTSSNRVVERFEKAIQTYNAASCYAVLKSEIWSDSWGSLVHTSCKNTWEIQHALSTYSAGNISTIDEIYWLRSQENPPIVENVKIKDISFRNWWGFARYASERKEMIEKIASIINKYNDIESPDSEIIARTGMEMFNTFFQYNNRQASLFSRAKIKGAVVSLLKAILPISVYKTLNYLYTQKPENQALTLADIGTRADLSKEEFKNKFKFDTETDKDLKFVENLLIDFYKYYKY
jgi:glycosyltransferase domain-containing protein